MSSSANDRGGGRVKVGLVGSQFVSTIHAESLHRCADAELYAVAYQRGLPARYVDSPHPADTGMPGLVRTSGKSEIAPASPKLASSPRTSAGRTLHH